MSEHVRFTFRKKLGILYSTVRTVMGTGEGMQTWDFSHVCVMSFIERGRCPQYGKKRHCLFSVSDDNKYLCHWFYFLYILNAS